MAHVKHLELGAQLLMHLLRDAVGYDDFVQGRCVDSLNGVSA